MKNLEVIDGKQTNWNGLWWHKEYNGFSSAAIDLSELRKFKGKVRLYVRKNKFFNNGENGKPNYNFCLKDAKSEIFTELKIWDDYSNVKKWVTCKDCIYRNTYDCKWRDDENPDDDDYCSIAERGEESE